MPIDACSPNNVSHLLSCDLEASGTDVSASTAHVSAIFSVDAAADSPAAAVLAAKPPLTPGAATPLRLPKSLALCCRAVVPSARESSRSPRHSTASMSAAASTWLAVTPPVLICSVPVPSPGGCAGPCCIGAGTGRGDGGGGDGDGADTDGLAGTPDADADVKSMAAQGLAAGRAAPLPNRPAYTEQFAFGAAVLRLSRGLATMQLWFVHHALDTLVNLVSQQWHDPEATLPLRLITVS